MAMSKTSHVQHALLTWLHRSEAHSPPRKKAFLWQPTCSIFTISVKLQNMSTLVLGMQHSKTNVA